MEEQTKPQEIINTDTCEKAACQDCAERFLPDPAQVDALIRKRACSGGPRLCAYSTA